MAMDRSSRPMHRGRKRFAASALIASTALITRICPACANTSASVPKSFPAASPALALSISAS